MDAVTNTFISIGELARLSGLSTHTLRYYEKVGVLRPAGRGSSGHRRYCEQDVAWLAFVLRLKVMGMPLAEICRYADLRADGDETLHARLTLLQLHRQRLVAKMTELSEWCSALDEKLAIYRQLIAGAGMKNGKATCDEQLKPQQGKRGSGKP